MSRVIVIDGDLSLTSQICGDLSLTSQICGEIDKVLMVDLAHQYYHGPYVVTPLVNNEVVLPTDGLVMTDDVTVLKVPYFETSNPSGGNTATIGEN